MQELIAINNDYVNDRVTTSARTLWEKLDRPYDKFTKWFDKYKEYGFVENEDYRAMCTKFHTAQGNESTATDYEIILDMAKELCMLQKTEKGRMFRQYFIKCEKELREQQKQLTPIEMIAQIATKMAADERRINNLEKDVKTLQATVSTMEPDFYTVKAYSTIIRRSLNDTEANKIGRMTSTQCKQQGITVGKVKDHRWGYVNSYPESILKEIFMCGVVN